MDSQDAFDSQFQESQPSTQRDESDVKRMKQVEGLCAGRGIRSCQDGIFMISSTRLAVKLGTDHHLASGIY